jgi:hypothetical protein
MIAAAFPVMMAVLLAQAPAPNEAQPGPDVAPPTVAPAAPAPAAPAPADPDAAAQLVLQDAADKLAALDDEGARALAAPLADDPTLTPVLRARASMTLGVALAQLGRTDEARNAFVLALAQDPKVAPPLQARPEVLALLEEARGLAAAPKAPPTALPARPDPVRENALGWVRPTSYVIMGAGAVVLVLGAATAVGAFVWREYVYRFADPAQAPQFTRLLFPMALAAGLFILLSIPTAGTGLALWFLSGADGPLRESRPDALAEDAPAPKR